ncbi:MAG: hypothetical protein IIC74_08400 [Bacteroidetes bacterium]|nr:hypothetical protein [Bacteroidota bacterium]
MKKLLFVITLLLFTNFSNSQSDTIESINPYYDAITLNSFIENGKFKYKDPNGAWYESDIDKYLSLLKIYFPDLKDNDFLNFVDEIKDTASTSYNPFIGSLFKTRDEMSSGADAVLGNDIPIDEKSASKLGGFNVTNIVDGLAKFLVKRTKEELNVAFFRKFKDVLENYPEFETLFPKTHNFVSFIEEQNYASMLQVLKQAFEDDMKTLIGNIPELRNVECKAKDTIRAKNRRKFGKCNDRVKEITRFFKEEGGWTVWTMSIFVDELISGKNAADALSSVFKDNDLKKFDIDDTGNPKDSIPLTYNVFKLLDLFSASLRSKEDNRIWVSSEDIKKEIIENDIQRTIYLGLLYQQSKMRKVRFPNENKKPIYFHDVLKKLKDSHDELSNFLRELSESFTKIELSLCVLKKIRLENKTLDVRTVDNYLTGIDGLFEATSEFLEKISENDSTLVPILKDVKKLTNIIEYGVDIFNNLEEKNYGSLIFNVTILLDNYMGEKFKFKAELIKYGTFMATVAQAENSDQIAAAIEAAALPSGSSSIKRKSSFNVSLNAYVGLFGGSEKIVESGEESFVTGLTSPVGVAVSWGRLDLGIIQGFTLFASIIDIGAITTYRFDDNNDAQDLPELSFENIIAPGIHGYINFRNSPLSLGGGYQLGPSTREINGVNESIRRWHITLVVDIPLMNFFTKSK